MPSEQSRTLRPQPAQPSSAPQPSLAAQRLQWEESALAVPLPAGVRLEAFQEGKVQGMWVRPDQPNGRVILHLHGGGFTQGSSKTHQGLGAQLALHTGCAVLLLDYPLAPEHPFPAAIQNVLDALEVLQARGIDPACTVLGGDSAGGQPVLAALVKLRDQGAPLPAAAFLFSGWLDLSLSGESMTDRATLDPMVTHAGLSSAAAQYLAGTSPADPEASPLFADLTGLPPMQVHVGDHEVLLSDSVRLAERLSAAGGLADLHIWESLWHVFPAWAPDLPEAREALELLDAFIEQHT